MKEEIQETREKETKDHEEVTENYLHFDRKKTRELVEKVKMANS